MPRKESLATIVPNRYYDLQATVKYFHRTEHGATAVIEQDQIQKKIMLPPQSHDLDMDVQYRFSKCFYSKSGWIKIKSADLIQQIKAEQNVALSLEELNERKETLYNNYITTTLEIVHVGVPQIKEKNGSEITLTILKGFSNNMVVDITLWNHQVSQDLLNKSVLLQGFRLKMLTKDTFVLVSTVYSKFTVVGQNRQTTSYDANKHYRSLSQVYGERTISEMKQTLHELTKCFSIIQGKITEATVFDYEGCKKCHKKLETETCATCGAQTQKQIFWVCQLELQDGSGTCSVFVFDSQLQGALRLTKKGSIIKGKIRSTIRLDSSGEHNIESHTLVGIKSITF